MLEIAAAASDCLKLTKTRGISGKCASKLCADASRDRIGLSVAVTVWGEV